MTSCNNTSEQQLFVYYHRHDAKNQTIRELFNNDLNFEKCVQSIDNTDPLKKICFMQNDFDRYVAPSSMIVPGTFLFFAIPCEEQEMIQFMKYWTDEYGSSTSPKDQYNGISNSIQKIYTLEDEKEPLGPTTMFTRKWWNLW
jgi:hypothetical protein